MARSPSPLELAPGLWALGGTVPVDGRISWFPPELRGHAPLLCYALRDGDRALVVDTGLPVHERQILEQLGSVLAGVENVQILLTRVPEFDSLGNAAAIARAFPVSAVWSHFDAGEWVVYQPYHDSVPPLRPAEDRTFEDGDLIRVGPHRAVEVVRTPLRLLSTKWIYDEASRTLFTSDSFGHAVLASPDEPWVLEEADDRTEAESVRAHLFGKQEWLVHAHTEPLREGLARVFEEHDVETIAPLHGRLLRGRALVRRHVELVLEALAAVVPWEEREAKEVAR
jgi:glyoxylase-like metal-dependent hydrolase (beta-lactamase superfamily II)